VYTHSTPSAQELTAQDLPCEHCRSVTEELFLAMTQVRDGSPLAVGRGPRKFRYRMDEPNDIIQDVCEHAFEGHIQLQHQQRGVHGDGSLEDTQRQREQIASQALVRALRDTCSSMVGDFEDHVLELLQPQSKTVSLESFQHSLCVQGTRRCNTGTTSSTSDLNAGVDHRDDDAAAAAADDDDDDDVQQMQYDRTDHDEL